jgi:fumarylpyruvate hydrolase
LPVAGSDALYPVARMFCVGRNYAEHAAEMGYEVDREAPFYFLKGPHAVTPSGATTPYPPGTANYLFEVDLVLALARPAFRASTDAGESAIGWLGCGLDMTRRDLQIFEREKKRPWDLGKDVEMSCVLGGLSPAGDPNALGLGAFGARSIRLTQNGTMKQNATLGDLVWKPGELVAHLARYCHLGAGDLIMSGTPAGVGPVAPGDRLVGTIDGLAQVELTIGQAE